MAENAVVERVSSVKSCLPAKAVVKTSPEFSPELADNHVFYSEERGEHVCKAQVPFQAVSTKHILWMDAFLGCFRHIAAQTAVTPNGRVIPYRPL